MRAPMTRISCLALLALAATLAACGQKGDLFLPDAAREAATTALTASGWQVRSLGPSMNGGFKAPFMPMPRIACLDGKHVDVNVGALDGATYLLLVVRRGGMNSICNQPVQTFGIAGGGLAAQMPRLDLPPAAGPAYNLANGGSSSASGNSASTSMDFTAPDSLDNIARHFARQIAAQGWSSDASWSGASTAGSSWSRRLDGGARLLGTLSLIAIDDRGFAASFRLVTLQ